MSSSVSTSLGKILKLDGNLEKKVAEHSVAVELIGSPLRILNGIYIPVDEKSGRVNFEKQEAGIINPNEQVKLFWNGNRWNLIHVFNNSENILGYAVVDTVKPEDTLGYWNIKVGDDYKPFPALKIVSMDSFGNSKDDYTLKQLKVESSTNSVVFGLPRQLLPLYISFIFDAIAVGLVMPLLPFFAMELGANAFELSLVASVNYFAQMIGAIVMGQVSDTYGRKIVLVICLLASSIQYIFVSYAQTLVQITLGRAICGMFGGLVPVMQRYLRCLLVLLQYTYFI